jgi:hypothetical protein
VSSLRNSRTDRGIRQEREAEMPRTALKMLDDALAVAFLVVRGSGVDVGHAKAGSVVERIASFRAVAVTAFVRGRERGENTRALGAFYRRSSATWPHDWRTDAHVSIAAS